MMRKVLKCEVCEGVASRANSTRGAGRGALCLWWLGQAGFLLENRQVCLVIDPYLSDSLARKYKGKEFSHERMTPVPIAPEKLTGLDYVFCTHGHTDHMDGDTLRELARVNPGCRFVVPVSQVALAGERGVPVSRTLAVDALETIRLDRHLSVTAVPAAHETVQTNASGAQMFLGYVLQMDSLTVYHGGDGVPYDDLAGILRNKSIDVALLPVNGRDAYRQERNIAGNFHFDEAIALCRDAQIPFMVPHHFGMFGFNTVDEKELAEAAAACGDVGIVMPRTDGGLRLIRATERTQKGDHDVQVK